MKIFGFPLSPFVRKVHIVATEKGVEFEPVLASPAAPSPEFAAASPFSKIPAMQHGDFTLADSTAIVTYIDALHPAVPITPGDARCKAKAIWFEEFADTILTPPGGKIVFNRFVLPKVLGQPGNEEVAQQGEAEIKPVLAYLERAAPADGWLAGDDFSIGDIAVASVLKTLSYVGVALDPADHPKASAWYARVCARPAWQAVAAEEAKVMGG